MRIAEADAATGNTTFTSTLSTSGTAAYGGTAPTATLATTVHDLINAVFGILGVIFFCLMVYAGILWMTAAGDPKKVQKAKDILSQSVIGLIIVVLSYGIAYTVVGMIGSSAGIDGA